MAEYIRLLQLMAETLNRSMIHNALAWLRWHRSVGRKLSTHCLGIHIKYFLIVTVVVWLWKVMLCC